MSTQQEPVIMTGGLNLAEPYLALPPGECVQLYNYEVNNLGRYQRINGYERFDGQTRPSKAQYQTIQVDSIPAGINVGDIVTGDTTGATGTVVLVDADNNALLLIEVSGTFQSTETINGSGVALLSSPVINGALEDEQEDEYLEAVLEHYRALIQPVPGSGPMRGVAIFEGKTYAFRDNAAGDACQMYVSSDTGWQLVTTPALLPGGQYKFKVANFIGSAGSFTLIGVDGINPAFVYDGTTFSQVSTGMPTDNPTSLEVLPSKILVLGYDNGSLMLSAIGDPLDFTAASGGAEIAVGDRIIELAVQVNQTLAIFCRNPIYVLSGPEPSTMELKLFTASASGKAFSVQSIGDTIFVSDNGITSLARVQSFGDFEMVTMSRKVKPLLDRYKDRITASFVVKQKNQYRLCFDDGSGMILTMNGNEVSGISSFSYNKIIRCATQGEDATGFDAVFFGSDDGYIYEAEAGYSFDGDEYTSTMRPAFNFSQSPEVRKRYKKVVLEVDATRVSTLDVIPELDYASPMAPEHRPIHQELNTRAIGGGGYYDEAIWNEVVWSTSVMYLVDMYIEGVGRNISVVVYSTAKNEKPHTINSMVLHWAPRGKRH